MTIQRLALSVACLATLASPVAASGVSWVDDLEVDASSMSIDRVELAGRDSSPKFYRDNVALVGGKRDVTLGLIYQRTSKGAGIEHGAPEEGLMLTVGWDRLLSQRWRLDLAARVGLTGTDEHQPLYAEDTDVRANFVWFDADGSGQLAGEPLFPSGYAGTIVNRFGRVQAVGGVGAWWRGLGTYVTLFQALNGDEPRFDAAGVPSVNYANLHNAGYSLSLSYGWRDLELRLKRNFPLDNGSDDLTIGLTYRHRPVRRLDR